MGSTLALLGPANVRTLSPFRSPSPDGKFEAVYADLNDTIHVGFKIIDRASGKTVAALDD